MKGDHYSWAFKIAKALWKKSFKIQSFKIQSFKNVSTFNPTCFSKLIQKELINVYKDYAARGSTRVYHSEKREITNKVQPQEI